MFDVFSYFLSLFFCNIFVSFFAYVVLWIFFFFSRTIGKQEGKENRMMMSLIDLKNDKRSKNSLGLLSLL